MRTSLNHKLNGWIRQFIELKPPISHFWNEFGNRSSSLGAVTVLDIGFGHGSHWRMSGFPEGLRVTGVDASVDWLLDPRSLRPSERLNMVVPKGLKDIPGKSFDYCIAFDLIEHLSAHEGHLLIYEMERIARKKIYIFTPNGFVEQHPRPDNPFDAHISGWKIKDFKAHGFQRHFGCVGFIKLYGPYAVRMNWTNINLATLVLSFLLNRISQILPRFAFSICHEKALTQESIRSAYFFGETN